MGASPRGVDWNEDGLIDLISGENNGKVKLFLNTGQGGPGQAVDLTDAGYIKANNVDIDVGSLSVPEVNDWNEDGLKDLVMAPIDGRCLFWPNHGTNAAPLFDERYELTTFTDPIDPQPGANNWPHFDVCDWNEDGHPDLLFTRWESDLKVHLHGTNNIELRVEPINPPVVVPAAGGIFDYRVSITNHGVHDIPLDLWTEFVLPSTNPYGPVRQVAGKVLPAGAVRNFPLIEGIPRYAPAGTYTYNLFLGKLGDRYYLADGFTLKKL